MTTRDKILQIRAEQPNAHAAQIARLVGVTSGRVYQLLKEQGLATTIPGAKGRPRQKTALWVSRKRKGNKIKERLNLGGEYTEANGTVWRYRADLIDAEHPAPVQVGERIWGDLDAALESEV
jgi:hypothetical protein